MNDNQHPNFVPEAVTKKAAGHSNKSVRVLIFTIPTLILLTMLWVGWNSMQSNDTPAGSKNVYSEITFVDSQVSTDRYSFTLLSDKLILEQNKYVDFFYAPHAPEDTDSKVRLAFSFRVFDVPDEYQKLSPADALLKIAHDTGFTPDEIRNEEYLNNGLLLDVMHDLQFRFFLYDPVSSQAVEFQARDKDFLFEDDALPLATAVSTFTFKVHSREKFYPNPTDPVVAANSQPWKEQSISHHATKVTIGVPESWQIDTIEDESYTKALLINEETLNDPEEIQSVAQGFRMTSSIKVTIEDNLEQQSAEEYQQKHNFGMYADYHDVSTTQLAGYTAVIADDRANSNQAEEPIIAILSVDNTILTITAKWGGVKMFDEILSNITIESIAAD
jgi:hypothetical protein